MSAQAQSVKVSAMTDRYQSVTAELCGFVEDLAFARLPAEVIHKAKMCLLDMLGYTFCAHEEKPARILVDFATAAGGRAESTVLGCGLRTSSMLASLVNGTMGHMAEMDDTHRWTMAHVGDGVIAAGLATAEKEQCSGKDLITAMVGGYEVACRAGEIVMPMHYRRGWHPSGTVATFGAAVAAGKLLRLDAEQFENAIGIAGTQMAGSFAHLESRGMTKDLNPGHAAMSGVVAAELARRGFTGGKRFFDQPKGLGLYSDELDLSKATKDLGKHYKILEQSHKVYTACRHIHSSIDAVLMLREKHGFSAKDVASVNVRIWTIGMAYVDDPTPWAPGKGLQDARFSMQFNLAVALLGGRDALDAMLGNGEAAASHLNSDEIRALSARVTVTPDEEMDGRFPEIWPAEAKITLNDGRQFEARVDYPTGEPENPVNMEYIQRKFRKLCCGAGLTESQATRVIDLVEHVESLDSLRDVIQAMTLTR